MNPQQLTPLLETARRLLNEGKTATNEYLQVKETIKHLNVKMASASREGPCLDAKQIETLKLQILAFRLLASNSVVPLELKNQLFEESGIANHVVGVGAGGAGAGGGGTTGATTTTLNPYSLLPPLSFSSHDAKLQRLLIPAIVPPGFDSLAYIKRANLLHDQAVAQRIADLSAYASNISNSVVDSHDSLKVAALIELKSLKLASLQQSLRSQILKTVSTSTSLLTTLDKSTYKRLKKQTIRDARQTEKIESLVRVEREKREKQKTSDWLNMVLTQGRDLLIWHRNASAKGIKLGQAVLKYHQNAEKEEQKRILKISQDRLKALKENDEEAYLKLVDEAKDTRITTILSQTTSYLSTLTDAVLNQKSEIANGESLEVKPDDDFIIPTEGNEEEGIQDYYNTAHKVREIVVQQPTLLVGGQLKDYQIKGLQWMVSLYNNRLNGILADEMYFLLTKRGLGKTIQTIAYLAHLIEKKKQPGPFLVIVPLSTISNWKNEFDKWAPGITKVVYKGTPNERKKAQGEMRQGPFNVLLTTYEYIIKDRPLLAKIKWVSMIIDEGHRMKNANSKLSVTLMTYYSSRYRIILTGTPLQNNLPELWALLNFILPKIFNSVKSFDEWFNSPFNGGISGQEKVELNEEESLLIIRRLHKVLRPFLLRRLKKDVESELPDKVETVIKCNMSALQLKLHEQLRQRRSFYDGGAAKGGGFGGMKALNNLVMQFRKICNHPFVFPEVENVMNPTQVTDSTIYRVCGKFEFLDRVLPKYFAGGHRILMFFQMTQIMDIMEDYLRWRGYNYLRLDGSIKADDRGELLKLFNAPNSPYFIFLLSTRAGGLGLNLQTADTVIIYDSDWNPHQDLQAQDRAHRIGQTKEVRILRLITSKSIEEHILARAQFKLDLDGKVIQAGKFDNKTTDAEREELLRSLFGEKDEDKVDGEDVEDLSMNDEELNEVIARNDEEIEMFKRMDEERVSRDISDWNALGKNTPWNKHRLMLENELAPVYLVDINQVLEDEQKAVDAIPVGRGGRERKEIYYDDPLNEEQWVNAVDRGDDLEGLTDLTRQSRNSQGRSVFDDDVDEDAPKQRTSLAKNPSKPAAPKRKKKNPFGIDVDEVDTHTPEMRQAMIRVFQAASDAVEDKDVVSDGIVRQQSELFLTLPSKSDYPDYYKIIKNPIAIDWIQARIDSTYYKSVADFHRDYNLMFSNAMTYNEEGSDVYMDALELKQAFENALAANLKNGQIVITPEDIEAAKAAAVKPVEVAKPDLAPSPKKKPVAKKPAVKKRRVSDYESDGSESEVEIEEPVRKKVKESEFLPSLAHLPPKNF